MKSYTDISQSRKLSEILPVESADMWWSKNFLYYNPTACVGISSDYTNVYTYKWGDDDIPCWSLSALLEVIPEVLVERRIPDGWDCVSYAECQMTSANNFENLVDACVEVICKLKERNLL